METTTQIIQPRQFAFHDRVAKTPPENGAMIVCFNRLANGEDLTRNEKNSLFESLQSQGYNGYYRLSGWEFNFRQFMKRYLVKYNYDNSWTEIWAFDKTCVRNSDYTKSNILEIIQA